MTTVWDSPRGWAAISVQRARGLSRSQFWGKSWRLHLGRGTQYRPNHAVMRTATTQIAVERDPHIHIGRIGIPLQQRGGAHQDAGDAIAALQRLLGDEGALQRMRSE